MGTNQTKPDRHDGDAARLAESAAILRRIRQETEPQVGATAARMADQARRHFAGVDAGEDDRIEVLGRRIGRLLGLVAFAGLAVSLLARFLRG